jgi:single-stranded-DNA-specific exonuclease
MSDLAIRVRTTFQTALEGFGREGPVLVLGHHDADGLSAMAIFIRAFQAAGRPVRWRIVGRGENPWSCEMRAELVDVGPLAGLIVTDLGLRDGEILPGVPTVIVDHHVPTGGGGGAAVITGFGETPIPTSSLLAYWCAGALSDPTPLLWLAALGLIGDMADAHFEELNQARARYGATALKEAVALINAPRRAADGDATPALALLLKGDWPKAVLSGDHPETARLLAAREEVKAALEVAKRVGPRVRDGVALIVFSSPCQIHPLVAQAWRMRLRDQIVIAANTGYRDGWVHFAARSARDRDLIAFLREHAPPGADENYGSGHRQATGGALRLPDWRAFAERLGFSEQEARAA